jgi:hypothetical protein
MFPSILGRLRYSAPFFPDADVIGFFFGIELRLSFFDTRLMTVFQSG